MDSNGNIDREWMDRVQQVVDYAYSQGMYVIINVHHDGGGDPKFGAWIIEESQKDYNTFLKKYKKMNWSYQHTLGRGSATVLLDIKSLRVFYGRVEAVHGVDFHVDTGEVVTIIGNNGAGKSSILRAISGVVKGVTGTIRFNGQLINEMNSASIVKLGISQTPEGRQVFPESTVYENLVGGAYIRKDKQKIKEDIDGLKMLLQAYRNGDFEI